MIRLLIATSDRQAGGIQRALRDQLALFADSQTEFALTILCPASDFAEQAKADGHKVIILTDKTRLLARYLPFIAAALLRRNAATYDIVLCHNGFLAKTLSKIARHLIGICHNDKPQNFMPCDRLICLTPDGMAKAQSAGWQAEALTLIPHYHETDPPAPAPKPITGLTIGAAGRMVAKKNLSLFIDIAAIVHKTHPDIRFQLAGTGPLLPAITAHNQAKGNPVTLLGWTDFAPFLAAIDIMVIPSLDEPFGYVYPEAMSQGVAILSSPTFGGRYHLGTITQLSSFDDPIPYAREIIRLASDKAALLSLQTACQSHSRTPAYHAKTARAHYRKLLLSLG